MQRVAFYCSGGASRVLGFFAMADHVKRFAPALVIYDGGRPEVEQELSLLFADALVVITTEKIERVGVQGIHSATSILIKQAMEAHSIDYLLCFGDKILKPDLIQAYPDRLINFHPSLLPAFPGLNAIDQAQDNGALMVGNTAHFIDEGIDTGRIILQAAMRMQDMSGYADVLDLQYPMLKVIFRDLLGVDVPKEEIDQELRERPFPVLMPSACAV